VTGRIRIQVQVKPTQFSAPECDDAATAAATAAASTTTRSTLMDDTTKGATTTANNNNAKSNSKASSTSTAVSVPPGTTTRRNYSNFTTRITTSTADNIPDDGMDEEKERKELEWLVKSTNKLLGPDLEAEEGSSSSATNKGPLSEATIHKTQTLMKSWSRRASRPGSKAPHVVERLLQTLIQEQDAAAAAGNENETRHATAAAFIDANTYNILLDAWSRSTLEGSAARAEAILLKMEQKYANNGSSSNNNNLPHFQMQPNEASYNTVIKAYVKNGNRLFAAQKAQAIIDRMESNYPLGVAPNRRSYNLLLYALANSSGQDAGVRAEGILRKIQEAYKNGRNTQVKPDINSYNQVLTTWARARHQGYERRMQAIFDEILHLAVKDGDIYPNTDTFNAIMGGWLKSNDKAALERIEEILKIMEESYQNGNEAAKPDRVSINTISAAYTKNGKTGAVEKTIALRASMETKYEIDTDTETVSCNILVDSWCKSGRPDGPERVLDILNAMERDFKKGKISSKPDAYTYCSVIDCFQKCAKPDAPERAEEILLRMKDLYRRFNGDPVTTSLYNAVINSWASSDSEYAPKRARNLLQEMQEKNGKDLCIPAPDRITYNSVIKAMRGGTTQQATWAEDLLSVLEKRGPTDSAFLPDAYTYTSTITAYGRSDYKDKAPKALELLQRMVRAFEQGNDAAKPTVHSFNAGLNACAFVKGDAKQKSEAFSITMDIFSLLHKWGEADHTTYGTILRACACLLPLTDKRRVQTVDDIFQKAATQGQVGRLVMAQMKFAATPQQHLRLTGQDYTERTITQNLPRAWTRHVREQGVNRRAR
jgi:hypothetical protein